MSIWSKLTGSRKAGDKGDYGSIQTTSAPYQSAKYALIDIETGLADHKIHDIGAIRPDGRTFHKASKEELFTFLSDAEYVCGHNIIHHDAKYLFRDTSCKWVLVDTLYISPLLFPERPCHKLLKDDKLVSNQMNNPVNDCRKAETLLLEEIECWNSLPAKKRRLFASLLHGKQEFDGFLKIVNAECVKEDLPELIKEIYKDRICCNTGLDLFINKYPCSLAYALALIDTTDFRSITPG